MLQPTRFVVVLALSLSACAGVPQTSGIVMDCDSTTAYERGFNEARNGKPMDSSFTRVCDPFARDSVSASYRQGFEKGMSLTQPTTIVPVPMGSPQPASADRAYYCQAKAFTDHFEAFGPTQLEATKRVQAACRVKFHEMHCEAVQCQKNQ